MKNFKSFIKENKVNIYLRDFLDYSSKELRLKNLPKIELVDDKNIAVDNRSFGGYSPVIKSITINIAKRHPADVYRTLAHELVHYKQDEEGRLSYCAGKTGDQFENEANTLAGIIMRNYSHINPKIYE
jgi:Zn-dependent peptidase ImmA (M78 family)